MLHTPAKLLLIATSLSPVLLVVAVVELESACSYVLAAWLAATATVLSLLCHCILSAAKRTQTHRIEVSKVERRDHEVLAYLFVYLLPFVRGSSVVFEMPLTLAVVLVIIVTALLMANALHFNPTMWILGYRFYAVEDQRQRSLTLIGRRTHPDPGSAVSAHQLSNQVYVLKEDKDVR